MPEEIENQEPEIAAFAEYEVEGVGTVIDPEGELGYRVRLLPNAAGIRQVTAYPALSGDPSEANAAADIAHALANPVTIAPRWRVLKDTIWMRIKSFGNTQLVTNAQAMITGLPAANRIDWDQQIWFWSDNLAIRQVLTDIGCTSEQTETVLAVDPLAP